MTAPTPRVLSVIPPMTQLNTPYPSTAYLTGFLRSRGLEAVQEDLALALVLELFSPAGLQSVTVSRGPGSTSDRASTVTPGSTAPPVSTTFPLISPVCWAAAGVASARHMPSTAHSTPLKRMLFLR